MRSVKHTCSAPEIAVPMEEAPKCRSPACFHCQYDLTGFIVGQTCPECGNQILALVPYGESLWVAKLGLILGLGASGALILGVVLWMIPSTSPMMALSMSVNCLSVPLSYIGLITSGAAWWEIRQHAYVYSPRSKLHAKIGFFLCLAPAALTIRPEL